VVPVKNRRRSGASVPEDFGGCNPFESFHQIYNRNKRSPIHQQKGIRLAGLAGLAPDRLDLPDVVRIRNLSEIPQNFKSVRNSKSIRNLSFF
jgi:hypothetical protein